MSEVLFRASVEQGQVKVSPVKPGFNVMQVFVNINQLTVWV